MINYRRLRDWHFPVVEHSYSIDDSMLYGLAVTYGSDPTDLAQLKFVSDVHPGQPVAVPTMAAVLGFPGTWMSNPDTGIDYSMIVHGEEMITFHKRIPSSGTVIARHQVSRVVDKGPGRGATITFDKDLFEKATGDKLATVSHTTFARGDGGFSQTNGQTDEPLPAPMAMPSRAPDRTWEAQTVPQQALLYRLCADHNPVHADPDVAKRAGFPRPLLHGLGSYGVACRALLTTWCEHDPDRLKSLFARFTSPVFPGETLRFEMYREDGVIAFRARVAERDKVALDYGRAEISGL